MAQQSSESGRLPKGVSELARSRGGRRFLSKIRHKGVEIHLGIYESAGLAGFAFNVAWEAIGRGSRPPNDVPGDEQPDAESVWRITSRVRRRLGLDPAPKRLEEIPPDPEALLTLFEVTVVGFGEIRPRGRTRILASTPPAVVWPTPPRSSSGALRAAIRRPPMRSPDSWHVASTRPSDGPI